MSTPYSGAPASQAPPTPIYVGLDLSLTSTGVAIIHDGHATVQRITSKPTKNATTADQAARLDSIVQRILAAIPHSAHTKIAVEGPSFGSTGTAAHILGGLWWLVRVALVKADLDFTVVASPGTVKRYATGNGNAPKDHVLAAVVRRYPDVDVSGNDEADALVLAAIRARHDGHPFEESLPAAQSAAVSAVTL